MESFKQLNYWRRSFRVPVFRESALLAILQQNRGSSNAVFRNLPVFPMIRHIEFPYSLPIAMARHSSEHVRQSTMMHASRMKPSENY